MTTSLRGQLEQVQRERDELLALQHGVPTGDRASTQHGVPPGDRASTQHGVPAGDRASTQHGVPAGDRASLQHGVPAGDRASLQHGVPPGDRASLQHAVPPGDRASLQHGVPPGDRASTQHGVPAGDRASTQHGVPAGDRASLQHGVPAGDRASTPHEIPPNDLVRARRELVVDREVQGESGGSAGHAEERRESDRREGSAIGEDQGCEDGSSQGAPHPQNAEPSQLDLLGVIAAGMKQLQEAQMRAYDKKANSVDPETVKPGVSALPELKPPEPETSPVEVQDWLQLLQAPMADLSDSSHEWWHRRGTSSGPAPPLWSGFR